MLLRKRCPEEMLLDPDIGSPRARRRLDMPGKNRPFHMANNRFERDGKLCFCVERVNTFFTTHDEIRDANVWITVRCPGRGNRRMVFKGASHNVLVGTIPVIHRLATADWAHDVSEADGCGSLYFIMQAQRKIETARTMTYARVARPLLDTMHLVSAEADDNNNNSSETAVVEACVFKRVYPYIRWTP